MLFQPTLPARGATRFLNQAGQPRRISTHAPRTGSDQGNRRVCVPAIYFNPRSPHGERHSPCGTSSFASRFQPTLPARGATIPGFEANSMSCDFNPRSPHGERRRRAGLQPHRVRISTHAPRTGSDQCRLADFQAVPDISTHAPRTGSDMRICGIRATVPIFQPTLPARGATKRGRKHRRKSTRFQPTLPARGATRRVRLPCAGRAYFNPRSPHGERHAGLDAAALHEDFNPRSPHGERLALRQQPSDRLRISTHAPRTGSDSSCSGRAPVLIYFNPRSPHGERPAPPQSSHPYCRYFNPRSPHGERHGFNRRDADSKKISTHAPRTGSDPLSHANKQANKKISTHAPRTGSDERIRRLNEAVLHFNPRSPHGERPDGLHRFFQRLHDFNPRSPHGERLLDLGTVVRFPRTFQPTLPARGATGATNADRIYLLFQPTLPARGATNMVYPLTFTQSISTHAPRTGSDQRRRKIKFF